jgi:hypothetical protein
MSDDLPPILLDLIRQLPTSHGFDLESGLAEGWRIARYPDLPDEGSYRLEAVRSAGVFASDEDAWTHLARCAVSGSRDHIRALRFIRWFNPEEWERIESHATFVLGIDLFLHTSARPSGPEAR